MIKHLVFSVAVLCNFCATGVYAETSNDATLSASEIAEYKYKIIEDAKQSIKNEKHYYSCGGIGLIDHGSALDRDVIFFSEPSKEFVCTYSISMCVSVISDKGLCICPPPTWKASGCWDKYTNYVRSPKQ